MSGVSREEEGAIAEEEAGDGAGVSQPDTSVPRRSLFDEEDEDEQEEDEEEEDAIAKVEREADADVHDVALSRDLFTELVRDRVDEGDEA